MSETTPIKLIPYVGFYTVDLFDCPQFRMFTAGDCPRAQNIMIERSFEPTSMGIWCHLAREATSILDIGAHVGVYALAAAILRPDSAIHAFEPNPNAWSRLRIHMLANVLMNIREYHVALSDKHELVPFSWPHKPGQTVSSGGRIGRIPESAEHIVVETDRLDAYGIDYGSRPLIKIDVEGGEVNVFRGMGRVLEAKPDIILESFSQANCDAIWEMLPQGYQAYRINEREMTLQPLPRLTAADVKGRDFNQFLTTRPLPARWHFEAAE